MHMLLSAWVLNTVEIKTKQRMGLSTAIFDEDTADEHISLIFTHAIAFIRRKS